MSVRVSGHKATWKLGAYPMPDEPLWERIAYEFLFPMWRHDFNTCAECGSDNIRVENKDMMWGDGDVYCENDHYVRMWDSG